MPEVVEVCLTSIFLNKKLKGKKLVDIIIHGGRYKRYGLNDITTFKHQLPFIINSVNSKGKFMWFELSKGNKSFYILNTYGLEGEWGFTKSKHSNVEFKIKHNNKIKSLYFTDSRNFGTIELSTSRDKLDKKLHLLAPDFLKEDFTETEFYKRIEDIILDRNDNIIKSRGNKEIVKVLMTQTKPLSLGSGLGNYLAVEVLYHAKISPYKTLEEIYNNKTICNRLSKSIKYITKLSFMTADIGYMEHLDPKMASFINEMRKDIKAKYNYHSKTKITNKMFTFNVYRQKKDPYGHKVIGDKIITGRTTYWVPTVQK